MYYSTRVFRDLGSEKEGTGKKWGRNMRIWGCLRAGGLGEDQCTSPLEREGL